MISECLKDTVTMNRNNLTSKTKAAANNAFNVFLLETTTKSALLRYAPRFFIKANPAIAVVFVLLYVGSLLAPFFTDSEKDAEL